MSFFLSFHATMLSIADNPPILSPDFDSVVDFVGQWWVGHTKSRFEKAFANDLLNLGIAYFLPMVEKTRIISGKRRTCLIPLFSSYVFFCGMREDHSAAISTNRLCRTIRVTDREGLVQELRGIERVLHAGLEIDNFSDKVEGERYRIMSGKLKGLEGIISNRTEPNRMILPIKILGQGASIKVDAEILERIDSDE
jgi:hypothetical protein